MIFLLHIMLYKVYVYCKQVVKMPVKASAEKRELILQSFPKFIF
jgi:predicted PilT family ATPase